MIINTNFIWVSHFQTSHTVCQMRYVSRNQENQLMTLNCAKRYNISIPNKIHSIALFYLQPFLMDRYTENSPTDKLPCLAPFWWRPHCWPQDIVQHFINTLCATQCVTVSIHNIYKICFNDSLLLFVFLSLLSCLS